jgi:hypothetical protein
MRRRIALIAFACAAITAVAAAPGFAAHGHNGKAKGPAVCKGTLAKPGTLSGTYRHGVVVKGACAVDSGPADVIGTLKVDPGSTLSASYGQHDSHLTVHGNVLLGHGATFVLGCYPQESPCNDDNPKAPTLSSEGKITGNLHADHALGLLIHNSKLGGNVTQVGGGGGLSCNPPKSGAFALFHSPVFSTYEDSSIHGSLEVKDLKTCWLGIARVHVGHNLSLIHNDLADPDGIEVLSSHIRRNLVCRGNGHPSGMPPGTQPVWDSSDTSENSTYPRQAAPNTVGGKRFGQCKLASPATQGGPLGPGAF